MGNRSTAPLMLFRHYMEVSSQLSRPVRLKSWVRTLGIPRVGVEEIESR